MKPKRALCRRRVLALIAALSIPATVFGGQQEGASTASTSAESIKASGSVAGNVYTNGFFRFSYEFPSHLTVQTQEDLRNVMDMGHKAGWGTEPHSDPEHRRAEELMVPLLSLVGAPRKAGEVPQQVLISAIDLSANPELTQRVLLGQLVVAMISPWRSGPGEFKTRGNPGVGVTNIGGQEFAWGMLEGRIPVSGKKRRVYTDYWVTTRNGYAVIWQLAAGEKQELTNLEKTINSVRFNIPEPTAEPRR
ncbi:MAG: hypothetical protein ACRD4U_03595 [Candidatus Acidiferrales bacterium]